MDVSGEMRLIAAILQQALADSADGMRAASKAGAVWSLEYATRRAEELNAAVEKARDDVDSLTKHMAFGTDSGPLAEMLPVWLKEARAAHDKARFAAAQHLVPFDALRWILDDDNRPMSCRWVCDHLGIDYTAIREAMAYGSRRLANIGGVKNVRPKREVATNA